MKKYLKYIYLFAFITVAYILLPVMNGDYLYTIQDNNVFINGHTFMMETVTGEGGWIVWVARYLTQFFYHPWLGSTILILFWVAIYWITIRMFNIKDKWCFAALAIPVFLLYDLLSRCKDYTLSTFGLFDVTVESAEHDAAAIDSIILSENNTVTLTRAGVYINMSGILKGYALDRLRMMLEHEAVADARFKDVLGESQPQDSTAKAGGISSVSGRKIRHKRV